MKKNSYPVKKKRNTYEKPAPYSATTKTIPQIPILSWLRSHAPITIDKRLVLDGIVFKENPVQRIFQRLQSTVAFRRLQLTLPNSNAVPAHLSQLALLLPVAFTITVYLVFPKNNISFRQMPVLAIMPVPETTVYKNTGTIFAHYNIRMTGQAWMVYPKAKTFSKKIFTHNYLRPCIL